ncbi:MAG: LysR substrate-binding domain-containing protein [Phycicoccus sp.]
MELRHLRSFVVVIEEASFGRAAARLHVTQPAISQQVRQLEKGLGVTLVDRRARPVRPTASGERLLEHARRLLDGASDAAIDVQNIGLGRAGVLRVGYVHGGLFETLVAIVRALAERRPDVRVTPVQVPSGEQHSSLLRQQVDLVLGRDVHRVDDDLVVRRPLGTDLLIALLPEAHPLAGGSTVELAALAEERFVFFARRLEPRIFDAYVQACRGAGFTPRVVHEVTDAQTQAVLAAAGSAVGLSTSAMSLRFSGVVYRVVEPRTPMSGLTAMWRRDAPSEQLSLVTLAVDAARSSWTTPMASADPR